MGAAQVEALETNAAGLGLQMQDLLDGGAVAPVTLEDDDGDGGVLFALRLIFGFMFASALLTFGLSIAQAVVEEKDSRVAEILAAAAPVRDMLVGKVLASFILGTGQVLGLALVALVSLRVAGVLPDLGRVVAASGGFVLGFLAIACLWAALGAMAARPDDLAASAVPVQLVLFGAYFLSFLAPEGLLRVTSSVPVLSSLTMPTRMLQGSVAWWEPALAALLVVGFGLAALRIAVAVYEDSLLRTNRSTPGARLCVGHVPLRETRRSPSVLR
jgi:ABC-2 type transport system permease protein